MLNILLKQHIISLAGVNQCNLLSCNADRWESCQIDKQGITNCVCVDNCESVVRPVCASDGVTYDNVCEMRRAACNKKEDVVEKYFGTCGELR